MWIELTTDDGYLKTLQEFHSQTGIRHWFFADNYRKYSTLMMGKQRSDCPLPCSTYYAEKKLLEEYSSEGTYISFEFSPRLDGFVL